jgi:hypothetical protein
MKIKLLISALLAMALSGCYTMIDPPFDQMVFELDSLDVLQMGPGNVEGDYIVNFYNDEYVSYDRYYQDPQHFRYNSWRNNFYWDPYYYDDRHYGRNWRWHHGHYTKGYSSGGGKGGGRSPKVKKSRRNDNPHRRPPTPDYDNPKGNVYSPSGQQVSKRSKPQPPSSGDDERPTPKSESSNQVVEKKESKPDKPTAEQVRKPRRDSEKPRDVRPVPKSNPHQNDNAEDKMNKRYKSR